MDVRQLRYFVAVAEELHFRRAAERLHLSQPALSQQIRALEATLEVPLFFRNRRRVELTAAGEAFLQDARRLLVAWDAAAASARRVHEGRAGRLRIGFVGSALLSIVPDVVQRFRAARPDVEVDLRERSTVDQLRALRANEIDIGLAPLPIDDDGLVATVLVRERTLAVVPVGHPLAAAQRIGPRRLAAEPFVLFPRAQAPGFHDLLLSGLTRNGVRPRVVHASEMQTIVGLVAAGIGVSLVPASVERLALHGVVYRPVVRAPLVELAVITRRGERSPLVQAFLAGAEASA
jgi:DNA-binding transcriptional LysR family regulator